MLGPCHWLVRMSAWVLFASAVAVGQATPQAEPEPPEEAASFADAISGALSLTLTNEYFFRGIRQEDRDLILQPALSLAFAVFESEEHLIQSVSLDLGTWNSLHFGPSGDGGPNGDPKAWYESDLFGGVSLGFLDDWSFSVSYTAYLSPNDAFDDVEELNYRLRYDDSALWDLDGFSGLQPSILFAHEVSGRADAAGGLGKYFEFGVAPAYAVHQSEGLNFSIGLPVILGLSVEDYFEANGDEDTFGFVDVGLSFEFGLGVIPSRFGAWSLHVTPHVLFLGDTLAEINRGEDVSYRIDVGFEIAF